MASKIIRIFRNNYSAENIKSEYKDLPVKVLSIYGKLKEQYKLLSYFIIEPENNKNCMTKLSKKNYNS